MKYLFLILLSFNAFAENWMPKSLILAGSNQAFQLKSSCEKQSGQECFDIGVHPSSVYSEEIGSIDIPDPDNEGQTIPQATSTIVLDQSKLDAYNSAKQTSDSLASAMSQANKRLDCGKGAIALVLVLNSPKNLTEQQVATFSTTFAPIQNLLLSGSLTTAKSLINSVEADGTIVKESDKTSVVNYIDNCIAN